MAMKTCESRSQINFYHHPRTMSSPDGCLYSTSSLGIWRVDMPTRLAFCLSARQQKLKYESGLEMARLECGENNASWGERGVDVAQQYSRNSHTLTNNDTFLQYEHARYFLVDGIQLMVRGEARRGLNIIFGLPCKLYRAVRVRRRLLTWFWQISGLHSANLPMFHASGRM